MIIPKERKVEPKKIKRIPKIRIRIRRNKKRKQRIRSVRSTIQYKLWRLAILQRDNHTCLECGSKERLEVDHILPASTNPELLMTDSNARTLCKPCHILTDSYPKKLREYYLNR